MKLQAFARNMRAAPTDAEAIVWRHLRAHRFAGHKFKRQQPIGKYIVDFVCFEAGVIVEVDGGQHNESVSDKLRDEWLMSQGFAVLRFWNNEVSQNLDGVLTRILEALSPSPSVPPPRGGREETLSLAKDETGPGKSSLSKKNDSAIASFDLKISSSLPPCGGGTEGERSEGWGERETP